MDELCGGEETALVQRGRPRPGVAPPLGAAHGEHARAHARTGARTARAEGSWSALHRATHRSRRRGRSSTAPRRRSGSGACPRRPGRYRRCCTCRTAAARREVCAPPVSCPPAACVLVRGRAAARGQRVPQLRTCVRGCMHAVMRVHAQSPRPMHALQSCMRPCQLHDNSVRLTSRY